MQIRPADNIPLDNLQQSIASMSCLNLDGGASATNTDSSPVNTE